MEEENISSIGKKSYEFFEKRGYDILKSVESTEGCTYDETLELSKTAMDLYTKGEIDEVYVSYTEFVAPEILVPTSVAFEATYH